MTGKIKRLAQAIDNYNLVVAARSCVYKSPEQVKMIDKVVESQYHKYRKAHNDASGEAYPDE